MLFNAWTNVVLAAIYIMRQASNDDTWPVVIKYKRWEYVLKTFICLVFAYFMFKSVYGNL